MRAVPRGSAILGQPLVVRSKLHPTWLQKISNIFWESVESPSDIKLMRTDTITAILAVGREAMIFQKFADQLFPITLHRMVVSHDRIKLSIKMIDSMNTGKSSQLGKHGFDSLHNLTWFWYYNKDILLRHWLRFTNEVDHTSLNSLLRLEISRQPAEK